MQYSDTTNKNGILQRIEGFLSLGDGVITTDTTYLKPYFTALINEVYKKIVTIILQSMDGWEWDDYSITATSPIATRAMVASRRDYSFNSANWVQIGREGGSDASSAVINPLQISRVDVTYDGTNYYKAEAFDSSETGMGLGNDTTTDARFSKTSPMYDLRNNAIWLYPLASASDVSAGAKIRITFLRNPTAFTTNDTTKEAGFDDNFQIMLPIGASLDWAISKGDPRKNDLMLLWQEWEARLRQHYGKKDLDRRLQLNSAFVDYS